MYCTFPCCARHTNYLSRQPMVQCELYRTLLGSVQNKDENFHLKRCHLKYLFIVNLVELTIFESRWLFLKVVASSISGGGWGDIHIFVFTDRKNNQFQKKLITAEHEYVPPPPPPPPHLSSWLRHCQHHFWHQGFRKLYPASYPGSLVINSGFRVWVSCYARGDSWGGCSKVRSSPQPPQDSPRAKARPEH